jgi:hypothetical protein
MQLVESEALEVRMVSYRGEPASPQAPQGKSKAVEDEQANGAEWRGQWCIIGGVAEYELGDAECHVYHSRRNETIAADCTKLGMDRVEEIANGPEKKEN